MVLLLPTVKSSQFFEAKKAFLFKIIKQTKQAIRNQQSTISSSFPYSVVLFRRPSTIPLLEVEVLVVS